MSEPFDWDRFKSQTQHPDPWERANIERQSSKVNPTPEVLEHIQQAMTHDDDRVADVCAMLLRTWQVNSPATRAALLEA